MRLDIFSGGRGNSAQRQSALPLAGANFGDALREIAKNASEVSDPVVAATNRVRFASVIIPATI